MSGAKIRVKLRSFDSKVIDQSAEAIVSSVKRTGAFISGPIPLPVKIRKYTVLRSPHVNKTAREQFEMRQHRRLIDINNPSKETIEALEKLDLPAGVEVELKTR